MTCSTAWERRGRIKDRLVPVLLTEHHAMKTYGGSGGEWSALRPGRFSPSEMSPRNTLDRRLVVPQSHSGRGGDGKNSQHPSHGRDETLLLNFDGKQERRSCLGDPSVVERLTSKCLLKK
jgi:hypothetical protein